MSILKIIKNSSCLFREAGFYTDMIKSKIMEVRIDFFFVSLHTIIPNVLRGNQNRY